MTTRELNMLADALFQAHQRAEESTGAHRTVYGVELAVHEIARMMRERFTGFDMEMFLQQTGVID